MSDFLTQYIVFTNCYFRGYNYKTPLLERLVAVYNLYWYLVLFNLCVVSFIGYSFGYVGG